jgi:hypothetical protein
VAAVEGQADEAHQHRQHQADDDRHHAALTRGSAATAVAA